MFNGGDIMLTPKMTFDEFVGQIKGYGIILVDPTITQDEAQNVAEQILLWITENQRLAPLIAEFLEWHRIDTGKIRLD